MNPSDSGHSETNNRGLIFNIQPFAIHDGPGIRTTVFMKGCPLTCAGCCNPDGLNAFPEIITRDIKCIRCGKCVQACPAGAITIDEGGRAIDRAICISALSVPQCVPAEP
ncbi:4Fe-4S binding protein [Chloroflexota bacterium]